MLFKLKYGKGELPMEIPVSVEVEVVEPPLLRAPENVDDAFISALENPTGSQPLREIIPPSGDVAIVVCDKTRRCMYPVVLPLLLNYLNAHGLPDSRMFLLITYGAHSRHLDEENYIIYGGEAIRRLRLFHHDCRDESRLVHVGVTSRGTPVRLNRRYLEAAMSIVLTSVGFHYFAGFGGGRKAVFPGLASEEGILRNHRLFVQFAGCSLSKIEDFKGNLSNPLSEDLTEAAAMAPPSFVLNFCLNREGEVSHVFAGDWRKSHERACQFLLRTRLEAKRKYDLIIASCGGHPKDVNFIQSHKTIDNAFAFVRPGGVLLVLASCEEGIGSESLLQWFRRGDAATMRNALLENYSMNGGTALALKAKADTCQIYLYSCLDRAVVKKMGLRPVLNLRQGLREILSRENVRRAAVLPEGAITAPAPE